MFTDKVSGKVFNIFGFDQETATTVQPFVGNQFGFSDGIFPFTKRGALARNPRSGELWYQDITTKGSEPFQILEDSDDFFKGGDGTVPLVSSIGQFYTAKKDGNTDVIVTDERVVLKPFERVTHTGMVSDQDVQKYILEQLDIDYQDSNISTNLVGNSAGALFRAFELGILGFEDAFVGTLVTLANFLTPVNLVDEVIVGIQSLFSSSSDQKSSLKSSSITQDFSTSSVTTQALSTSSETTESLISDILGVSLPLLGDQLQNLDAIQFVDRIKDSIVEKLESQFNSLVLDPLQSIIGNVLKGVLNQEIPEDVSKQIINTLRQDIVETSATTPEEIEPIFKKALGEALGPAGLNILTDTNNDNQIDSQDITDELLTDFAIQFRVQINEQINNLVVSPEDLIRSALGEALGSNGLNILPDLNNDGKGDGADIKFVQEEDSIFFDLSLSHQEILKNIPLDSNFGLPFLNFGLNGKVQVDFGYDFDFGFGISQTDGFFFDTNNEGKDELQISLDVTPDLEVQGNLGFLQLNVENKNTQFNGDFTVDIKDPNNNGELTFSELSQFDFDRDVNTQLTGQADVNLKFNTSIAGSKGLPSITSDFNLDWTFSDTTVDPNQPQNLGNIPEVSFNNVELDLGSFFNDFASPIVEEVQKITKPFDPILDVLNTNLPILDDVFGIELNILDIGSGNTDFSSALGDFEAVITAINGISIEDGTVPIPLGSFNLQDNGVDVRTVSDLTQVELKQVTPPQIPPLQQAKDNGGNDFFTKAEIVEGDGLKFPILEDPKQAFNLLLGKTDVDLFTFQLPGMSVKGGGRFADIPVWPLPPARIGFGGSVGVEVPGLTFGYDTEGLVNGKPFEGFFIDNSNNQPEFTLNAELFADGRVGLPVLFEGGGKLSINGEANFDLNDPNNDGKVRPSEIAQNIEKGVDCIFDIEGGVFAGADLFIEHITLNPIKGLWGLLTGDFDKIVEREEWNIATIELFDFARSCDGDDDHTALPPNLATPLGNGELQLNLGEYADARNINKDVINENFVITPNVIVSAFGEQETYSEVNKILASADTGNDVIALSEEVTAVAEFQGGLGDDNFYGGANNDQMWGDDGRDRLNGQGGNDLLVGGTNDDKLYGDEGNDQLQGNEGNDLLDGGQGDDQLNGGNDNDEIYGRFGNDILDGESGDDQLSGGEGDDQVSGKVGSDRLLGGEGNDFLDGGTENDSLAGDSGNDELLGGTGDDLLDGGEGDDTLKGGDGNDQLFGGVRVLTEPIFDENGEQVLDDNGQPVFTTPEFIDDAGSDFLDGGEGDDTLDGAAGDDFLIGGEGNDELLGETGDDSLTGEQGNDLIDGGEGNDTVNYDNSPDSVIVNIDETTDYDNPGGFLHETIVTEKLIPTDTEPEFAIAAGTAVDGFGTEDILRNLENIVGSQFDDILIGNATDNYIQALDGNDILVGNAGDDSLDGGNDIDTASYRRDIASVFVNLEQNFANDGFGGIDTLNSIENVIGSDFDDSIIGDEVDNIIHAGDGDDIVEARDGEDIIFGEAGIDTLYGEDGDDFLVGGEDGDILDGGNDIDTASYFTSAERVAVSLELGKGWAGDAKGDQLSNIENLEGSEFEDLLTGDDGENIISGLAGNDLIKAKAGDDWLDGGEDDDRLFGDAGNDSLDGQTGDDLLKGGTGNDILSGDDGNDRLFGQAGIDTLEGDDGNDVLEGGSENDLLSGSDGNDQLFGQQGDDSLDGGSGDDQLDGGSQNDLLIGGDGDDQLYGQGGVDTLEGNDGNDLLEGGAGNDQLSGDDGNDRLFGQNGNDQLTGGTGNDELDGGSGNDQLDGNEGNDQLYGQNGQDLLDGGNGNDVLFGGNNSDTLKGQADDDYLDGGQGNDWLNGNAGDDNLYGQQGDDELMGDDGNDYIEGGTGEDSIQGNAGDDRLYGNAGFDILEGGDGHDILDGGEDDDFLYGNAGSDRLYGREGEDYLDGDIGDDRLEGNEGDDQLLGQEGQDLLKGGDGEDQIDGGEDDDWLLGGSGVDLLEGGEGNDQLDGGDDNDQLYGNAGDDSLTGGQGNDFLYGNEGDDQLDGNEGNDFLYGQTGEDNLNGGEGNDNLYGGEDNDQLTGGDGNDLLEGNAGDDQLTGDVGDDQLDGGIGDDSLNGGEDNDQLYGRQGDDQIDAGSGNDYIEAGEGNDEVTAGEGVDQIYGEAGDDTLNGGDGNDRIEGGDGNDILLGEEGNDDLIGGEGDDQLDGGDGNDNLSGGLGNDQLDGGNGDNVLNGGVGEDTLTGGNDGDTFILQPAGGTDLIINFQLEQDILGLSGLTFEEIEIVSDVAQTNRTFIDVLYSGERLAALAGIQADDLQSYHFFPVTDTSIE